jgi:hypothetical protein
MNDQPKFRLNGGDPTPLALIVILVLGAALVVGALLTQ